VPQSEEEGESPATNALCLFAGSGESVLEAHPTCGVKV
jgi:hypothetical protein